jgi:hypothetical protein
VIWGDKEGDGVLISQKRGFDLRMICEVDKETNEMSFFKAATNTSLSVLLWIQL